MQRLFVTGIKPVDADATGRLLDSIVGARRNYDVLTDMQALIHPRDSLPSAHLTFADVSPFGMRAKVEPNGTAMLVRVGWLDAGTVNVAHSRFFSLNTPQRLEIGPWSHGGGNHIDPFLPDTTPTVPSSTVQHDEMMTFFEPRSILGYDNGDRFTPQRQMMRYIERIAATSKRVKVDTVSHTFEGREMLVITVSSEANMARLADIARDARRIADPLGATAGEIESAIKRTPAIVWLAHSVHGGEASGAEAGLALLYQLAAGTDAETMMALDSTVVLIDSNENPDGRERFTHDLERMTSSAGIAIDPQALNNAGSWPGPRTSHYYFDLNRDWFTQSHPESKGRVKAYLQWMPQVAVDLHEQGSSSSFYFAPPREPDNANNPKHLPKWFDIFAAAHGAAFDTHGWSYFRREGYDSFYPGYGEGWPMLTGSIAAWCSCGTSRVALIRSPCRCARTASMSRGSRLTPTSPLPRSTAQPPQRRPRKCERVPLSSTSLSRRAISRKHCSSPTRLSIPRSSGSSSNCAGPVAAIAFTM